MWIFIYNILSIMIYRIIFRDKKTFTFVVAVQMFLILALRDVTVGVDLKNYIAGYNFISKLEFHDLLSRLHFFRTADLGYPFSYESGYTLLNWIFGNIGISFHGFLVFCAAINIISFANFIYRYSKIPWLSFVLLCGFNMYIYAFGIIRQSLAVSLMLWTIPLMLDKKWFKVWVITFMAFSIHRTAIIFIVLFFIYHIQVDRKVFLANAVLWIIMLMAAPQIYSGIIIPILRFLGKRVFYINFQLNSLIILMLGIAIVIFLFIDFSIFTTKENNLILWGFLLSIPIEIIGMCNDIIARSVEYYFIFVVILLPNIISGYRLNWNNEINGNTSYVSAKWSAVIRLFAMLVLVLLSVWLMIHTIGDGPLSNYKVYGA